MFQAISRNFLENQNMTRYESVHLTFFKKSLTLLIHCLKEKNEKCEILIDWVRKTVVQKEKRNRLFGRILNEQYIHILGATGKYVRNGTGSFYFWIRLKFIYFFDSS